MVEEEIGCGIFHFCIITEAITPTITGKRAYTADTERQPNIRCAYADLPAWTFLLIDN